MVYNQETKQNPLFLQPQYIRELTNHEFSQVPIIKQIAEDNAWTVSSIDKMPLDANVLMCEQKAVPAKIVNYTDKYPLVTLRQLNSSPYLKNTNRAYRANALKNRILIIDIEPKADDELLKRWINFPSHYTEFSKNGGIHMLIQVPEELITEKNDYIFDTLTQIKDENNTVEYFFNNHYITFTRKIPTWWQPSEFTKGSDNYQQLKNLITHLETIDAEKQQNRVAVDKITLDINTIQNPHIKQHLDKNNMSEMHTVMTNSYFIDHLAKLEDKDNDLSKWEWTITIQHIHRLLNYMDYKIQQYAKAHGLLKAVSLETLIEENIDCMTDEDVIYLIYGYISSVLPYREKHDRIERDGMPWLLKTAADAFAYIKTYETTKGDNKYAHFYSRQTILPARQL